MTDELVKKLRDVIIDRNKAADTIEQQSKLLDQALETLKYYASVCGEDDQPTPAKTIITAIKQFKEQK